MADGTVKGLDSLQAKLSRLSTNLGKETAAALYLGGLKVEEYAKRSITEGGKTGKVYRKGKNGTIRHVASAPGEAPASDTGRLVNSIRTEVGDDGMSVTITAGGTGKVGYAAALEFGTSKMAARPYMRPALKKAKPEIEANLKKAAESATNDIKK